MFNRHTLTLSRFEGVKWPAVYFMHRDFIKRCSEDEYKQQIQIIREILRDPDVNPEWRLYEQKVR